MTEDIVFYKLNNIINLITEIKQSIGEIAIKDNIFYISFVAIVFVCVYLFYRVYRLERLREEIDYGEFNQKAHKRSDE